MPTLDTDVLVRFLVRDDVEQYERAVGFIESAGHEADALYVPLTVALELERVLRSRYAVSKESIIRTFVRLLETRELSFQDEPSVERALSLYGDHSTDFADCLHLASAIGHGSSPMVTFDRKASRMAEAMLLTASSDG